MKRPLQPKQLLTAAPEIFWPALLSPAAAQLVAQIYQLEQSQWWPESTLRAFQLRQFALLARHAHAQCEFYRQRFGDSGFAVDGEVSWSAFQSLPLLTRRELMTQVDAIHAREVPKQHGEPRLVQSSGSTGQVVAVRRTNLSQLMLYALGMRTHAWAKRDFSETLAVVRGDTPHMDDDERARALGWGLPVTLLYATGPCYTLPLATDVSAQADWLVRRNPGYLLTFPTNLNELLTQLERRSLRLPALREVRTMGETLSPELRVRCRELLGVSIVDGYSSQELGAIALECPEGGLYHLHSESLIVEVLNAAGEPCTVGEVGRVVVTDLHNFATPLLRYELGDHAEVGPICSCGRGLPTLKRIVGRERNMVILPNAERHWPLVGFHQFREIGPILQYQLIQHSLQRVEMRLVTSAGPLSPAQELRLTRVVQGALGHPFELAFTYFEGELARAPNGKFEEFISRVL